MKFGPVPLADAEGSVLAHAQPVDGRKLRKGHILDAADIASMKAAGVQEVIVAQLSPGDVSENAAAVEVSQAILSAPEPGLTADAAFTGRVNLRAQQAGILRVDETAVAKLNAINPGITIATLPPWQRVTRGMMVATIKIIPYAVAAEHVAAASEAARGALELCAPVLSHASLVVTQLRSDASEDKAVAALRSRLAALDVTLETVETVPHQAAYIAACLRRIEGDLILILTASATSDVMDVGPVGLQQAGGHLTRFGMPVDPGNLLFLGSHAGRAVIGLPGCARSPALNGADWVMERVICGVPPSAEDIAGMGVGGLLKEIPTRPQPRERRR
ncbi:MAG: molybdopterin-binding protein [Pseudomonadota bacterium]